MFKFVKCTFYRCGSPNFLSDRSVGTVLEEQFVCENSSRAMQFRGAIHQLLNIILQLRILVLLLVSTLPYVVKVKNYS
jgi:hypothetical protein